MSNICLPCGGKEFDTPRELVEHVQNDHQVETPIIWEGEYPS